MLCDNTNAPIEAIWTHNRPKYHAIKNELLVPPHVAFTWQTKFISGLLVHTGCTSSTTNTLFCTVNNQHIGKTVFEIDRTVDPTPGTMLLQIQPCAYGEWLLLTSSRGQPIYAFANPKLGGYYWPVCWKLNKSAGQTDNCTELSPWCTGIADRVIISTSVFRCFVRLTASGSRTTN